MVPRRGPPPSLQGCVFPGPAYLGSLARGPWAAVGRPWHLVTAGHPAWPLLEHPNPPLLLQVNQRRPDSRDRTLHACLWLSSQGPCPGGGPWVTGGSGTLFLEL